MSDEPIVRDAHPEPARFRLIVSYVLLVGVLTSAALIATGFVLALAVGWQTSLVGATPPGGGTADFGAIGRGLAALTPTAIVQLGLAVLVLTPVVRVATSLVAFALERDRLYVSITLAVFAVLVASIFLIR